MKFKIIIIGIALVLALCISLVAAVSGTDFEVVKYGSGDIVSYKYRNINDLNEEYTTIYTAGTKIKHSYVSFQPANIPNARLMMVNTDGNRKIFLPRSIDEWEIKFYSCWYEMDEGHGHHSVYHLSHLRNIGVVNLNEYFGEYVKTGLCLELSWGQFIAPPHDSSFRYSIPDVDYSDYDYLMF